MNIFFSMNNHGTVIVDITGGHGRLLQNIANWKNS